MNVCPHCRQEFETLRFYKQHVKRCESGPHARTTKSDSIRDESLDCYWCGQRYENFQELALHVQNHGVTNFDEAVRYYTAKAAKETQPMAVPAPKQGQGGTFSDFLKREHIKGEKATLTFLGAREPSNGSFSDLFVDVKLGNKQYTWGLKADSRNYATLFKRFGSNEKNWKGPVKVVIAKDKFINVSE
jgi:hypothetical protein